MLLVWGLLSLFPSLSPAATVQIAGRIFSEAGPLTGARVFVYQNYDDISAGRPFFTSTPSDSQGSYSFRLERGVYYFTASGDQGGRMFFCYHGGNPLEIGSANLWISFLATAKTQPLYLNGETSVQGVVTYKGKPVKGAFVAFYTLDTKKFKGLGFLADKGLALMKAVDDNGNFAFSLPPDKYVIIARKNMDGNGIQPLRKGDLFCYAPSNPVEIRPGKIVRIQIPCYPKAERVSFVESPKIKSNDFQTVDTAEENNRYGIKGKVTDSTGKPVPNVYVVAYPTGNSSSPVKEAENVAMTDAQGNYFLHLNTDGTFGLVVRQSLGGAPKSNDLTGLYNKNHPWQGISIKAGELIENINITLSDSERKLFE
jgi:hypothetical protein